MCGSHSVENVLAGQAFTAEMSTKDIPLPPTQKGPAAAMETDQQANQPTGTDSTDGRPVSPAIALLPVASLPQPALQRAANAAVLLLPTCPEIDFGSFSPPRGTVTVADNHPVSTFPRTTDIFDVSMTNTVYHSPIASVKTTMTAPMYLDSDTPGTHNTGPVTTPCTLRGKDRVVHKLDYENIFTKVDDSVSLNCIFALIDDKLSGNLSRITCDNTVLDSKTSQYSHTTPTVLSQKLGTDSGYDSALLTYNDTTPLSPRSDIFHLIDSSQKEQYINSSNQTNTKFSESDTASGAYNNVSPKPGKSIDTPKLNPSPKDTPFTCAHRTCNDITFLYMSPSKLSDHPTRANKITSQTPHHLLPTPDVCPDSQNDPDDILDTTLEVLESLDTETNTSPPKRFNFNFNTTESRVHNMDKQSTPKRLIKKATLNSLRKIRHGSNIPIPVTGSHNQPTTPNTRNTKHKLNVTDSTIDLDTPKSKINKLTDSENEPITQSILDFVIESTSVTNTHCSAKTLPGEKVSPLKQLSVDDFITQVTSGNFQHLSPDTRLNELEVPESYQQPRKRL